MVGVDVKGGGLSLKQLQEVLDEFLKSGGLPESAQKSGIAKVKTSGGKRMVPPSKEIYLHLDSIHDQLALLFRTDGV